MFETIFWEGVAAPSDKQKFRVQAMPNTSYRTTPSMAKAGQTDLALPTPEDNVLPLDYREQFQVCNLLVTSHVTTTYSPGPSCTFSIRRVRIRLAIEEIIRQ